MKEIVKTKFEINDKEKLEKTFYSEGTARFQFIEKLGNELQKRFKINSKMYNHDNEKIPNYSKELLIIAQTTDINKSQDGHWYNNKKDKAEAQFFGLLVAKGIVSEDALYEHNIMISSRHREILAVVKQLKDEGVEPVLKKPIHESIKSQNFER